MLIQIMATISKSSNIPLAMEARFRNNQKEKAGASIIQNRQWNHPERRSFLFGVVNAVRAVNAPA